MLDYHLRWIITYVGLSPKPVKDTRNMPVAKDKVKDII